MLVRRKNKDYRSREYLTAGEVSRLLLAAKNYGRYPDRNYALVLLTFRHGLRVSEICELRWDAISLFDKEIYITRKKGSDDGTHPLPTDEIEALSKLKEHRLTENLHVFVGERGEPLTPSAVQRLLTRLGAVAKLDIKLHPHQYDVTNIPSINPCRKLLRSGENSGDSFLVVLKSFEVLFAKFPIIGGDADTVIRVTANFHLVD